MTLQDLGSVGEFVAAIATLVTLVYLAFQLRQNTRTLRANSIHELTENILRASGTLLEPDNAELYLRGGRSFSSLTPEEKLRFQLLVALFVGRFDTVLEYRERGMVTDEYMEWQVDSMQTIFSNPGVREFWQSRQMKNRRVTPRVREWVQEHIIAAQQGVEPDVE